MSSVALELIKILETTRGRISEIQTRAFAGLTPFDRAMRTVDAAIAGTNGHRIIASAAKTKAQVVRTEVAALKAIADDIGVAIQQIKNAGAGGGDGGGGPA